MLAWSRDEPPLLSDDGRRHYRRERAGQGFDLHHPSAADRADRREGHASGTCEGFASRPPGRREDASAVGVKSARLSHLVSHGWDTWDTPTGRRVLSRCFEGRMKVAMDACSVPGVHKLSARPLTARDSSPRAANSRLSGCAHLTGGSSWTVLMLPPS